MLVGRPVRLKCWRRRAAVRTWQGPGHCSTVGTAAAESCVAGRRQLHRPSQCAPEARRTRRPPFMAEPAHRLATAGVHLDHRDEPLTGIEVEVVDDPEVGRAVERAPRHRRQRAQSPSSCSHLGDTGNGHLVRKGEPHAVLGESVGSAHGEPADAEFRAAERGTGSGRLSGISRIAAADTTVTAGEKERRCHQHRHPRRMRRRAQHAPSTVPDCQVPTCHWPSLHHSLTHPRCVRFPGRGHSRLVDSSRVPSDQTIPFAGRPAGTPTWRVVSTGLSAGNMTWCN